MTTTIPAPLTRARKAMRAGAALLVVAAVAAGGFAIGLRHGSEPAPEAPQIGRYVVHVEGRPGLWRAFLVDSTTGELWTSGTIDDEAVWLPAVLDVDSSRRVRELAHRREALRRANQ